MNKVAVDFLKEKPTIVFVWPGLFDDLKTPTST